MMKKRTALYCGIMIQTLSGFEARAMGPIPLPSQLYQVNPASGMTPQQKVDVQQAFSWVGATFQQNHNYCKSRGECLNLDLGALTNFINSHPTHPAKPLFQNVYNIIRQDSQQQKFVTQWVVFQNLSQHRQEEYRNGVRITPIRPQYVRTPAGSTAPAFFNQDDVLTSLLQAIEHRHKNCEEYITCLSGDLQIIKSLHDRLALNDPVRSSLKNLKQIIKNLANQKIFNTNLYLTLYNPLSADWGNTLKKHKAKKIASYGYAEWRQIAKNSQAVSWHAPRMTNGIPLSQSQATQPNMPTQKAPWWGWW
jgi:hypothetical protein